MSLEHTITEIISQEENQAVEFKSSDVRAKSIARELVAFSNTQGGVLLISIEVNREITGVNEDAYTYSIEEWVCNIARENIIPPIPPVE